MITYIKLKCGYCKKGFKREARNNPKYKNRKNVYCSVKCSVLAVTKSIKTNCGFCGKPVIRLNCEFKNSKSGKAFCSRSCSAKYNNKRRKKSRRSKIEIKFFTGSY